MLFFRKINYIYNYEKKTKLFIKNLEKLKSDSEEKLLAMTENFEAKLSEKSSKCVELEGLR